MAIKEYTNWNKRPSDIDTQQEPFRKYFIICEGANTETYYFRRLIDNRKNLGIKSVIDIILLEKEGEDRNLSNPLKLIQFAEKEKNGTVIDFDKKYDKMVIVFDADIFEYKSDNYDSTIAIGQENGNILAVTNPRFELFLLLHVDGIVDDLIIPYKEEFLKKENLHKNGFVTSKVSELTGMNPKKNPRIGELADNVKIAIEQEKRINQNILDCKGKITSNIGLIIQQMIDDDGSE